MLLNHNRIKFSTKNKPPPLGHHHREVSTYGEKNDSPVVYFVPILGFVFICNLFRIPKYYKKVNCYVTDYKQKESH